MSSPASTRARNVLGDLLAGLSIALVLIPQALAYAELAGLPAYHGLYAAVLAPIAAAIFASSRYLQTGPTAVTSLLTFGALAPFVVAGSDNYVLLAGLLALMVGVIRIVLGLVRGGALAYMLSPPVIRGFTVGAAVIIFMSQLPTVLGVEGLEGGVPDRAFEAIANPGAWHLESITIAAVTLAIMLLGRKIHGLFPGVLLAVVGGALYGTFGPYAGASMGDVPAGFITFNFDLPYEVVGELLLPAAVIAIVGFAEPTAIARTYAAMDRTKWDPNRELISQGVANVAAGAVGGFPVGGSFSRSALSRMAGTRTRFSGAVTGLVVMAFLPAAGVLAGLPKPVLGGVILGAIVGLLQFGELFKIVRFSWPQALVAWVTFGLTLALTPHVERALLAGLILSVTVHVWREVRVTIAVSYRDGVLRLAPHGVLWFASAQRVQEKLIRCLAQHPTASALELDLKGLGRIDYSGAVTLNEMIAEATAAKLDVRLTHIPPQCRRIVESVCPACYLHDT